MKWPPPRYSLFPTRRSSDLGPEEASSKRAWHGPQAKNESRSSLSGRHLGGTNLPAQYMGNVPQRLLLDSFRSEEHTSELQSRGHLVCRLLLEKKKQVVPSMV